MFDVLLNILLKVFIIFFIIFSLNFVFNKNNKDLLNKFSIKIVIGIYIGIVLSISFMTKISNTILFGYMFIGFVFIYLGTLCGITSSTTLLNIYVFFVDSIVFFIISLLLIIGCTLISKLKISLNKKIMLMLVNCFTFMNIEMYFHTINIFYIVIYNFSAVILLIVFHLIISFVNKEKYVLNVDDQIYIDAISNVNNNLLFNKLYRDKTTNKSFALLNIDLIDNVNKIYGKDIGDKLIKLVAFIIKTNINELGEVYHIEGDMFCVAFNNYNENKISIVLNIIRLEISMTNFNIDDNIINTTISVGIFNNKKHYLTADCINYANQALVNSKLNGRNKLTFYRDIQEL